MSDGSGMSEIRPALSAAEWGRFIEGYDGTLPIDRYIEEFRRLYGEDYTVEEMRAEYQRNAARDLLLADEGGYFTWEMVDALDAIFEAASAELGNMEYTVARHADEWRAARDRIASLLPPREQGD